MGECSSLVEVAEIRLDVVLAEVMAWLLIVLFAQFVRPRTRGFSGGVRCWCGRFWTSLSLLRGVWNRSYKLVHYGLASLCRVPLCN